jgi:hypothetical protein
MRFELAAPAEVPRGRPVPITLRLINAGDHQITVYLAGRPTAFDIVVSDETGTVVWRRLAGQTVAAILGVHSLEPGDTLTFEDVWPQRDARGQPVPDGTYRLVGLLPTDGPEPLRTPHATVRVRASP